MAFSIAWNGPLSFYYYLELTQPTIENGLILRTDFYVFYLLLFNFSTYI